MTQSPDFRRYLVDIDSVSTSQQSTDCLVIGAGIAGLRAAIEAAQHCNVIVITKGTVEDSNTWHAQGGIASVINKDDSFESHITDTLRTGGGLSDEKIVDVVVRQGPQLIRQLLDWGTAFDLTDYLTAGELTTRIAALDAAVTLAIDQECGRDFDRHTGVTLAVDGTGTEFLPLYQYGVWDIVSITSITEDDTLLSASYYAIYPSVPSDKTRLGPGVLVKYASSASIFTGEANTKLNWPKGVQNIDLVLTYGPASVPADIQDARDMLGASRILAEVGGGAQADSGGSVQSKRLGDFAVTYGSGTPFAGTVSAWMDSVARACAKYHVLDLRVI